MNRRTILSALATAAVIGQNQPRAEGQMRASSLRKLTDGGGGDNRATFTADGGAVLFASNRTGRSQIWRMRRGETAAEILCPSAANDFGRVALSPTGTHLCFSSDRGGQNAIYVLDLDSKAVSLVSDPRFWSFGPSWSMQGRIAYFARDGRNDINIWSVDQIGAPPVRLTHAAGQSRQPWWAPGGRELVYAFNGGTNLFQLVTMNADGSGGRLLPAAGSWQQPFWSPDGRQIAAAVRAAGGFSRIVVIDRDGGNLQVVDQPGGVDNAHPAWSPDGRSLVFTSGSGSAGALWHLDL